MIKVVWQLKVNFVRMIWENYEKKNYFISYQTIWGNPVSMIWENYGKKIFTQYRTRIQDKEVIWFLWQCQTINNYSYCLSLSMVLYKIVSKTAMLFILHYM